MLQVFGLPAKVKKDLTLGAPATVVRQVTLDVVKALENGKAGDSKEARYMITGERGSGKSMLLLQAVVYALEANWIVFYQPTASRWVDSSSQFAYNKEKMMFDQPEAAADMLQKLLAVNRQRLSKIKLEKDVVLEDGTIAAGQGLDKLVEHGLKEDSTTMVATLDAVLEVLSSQTQFPVLFAVDEVQTLFRTSRYRRPDYKLLEAYHLGMPRIALDYLSGAREFKRGAVLTSTAMSATDALPSESLIAGLGLPIRHTIHAYTPIDQTYYNVAKSGIKRFDVPFGMTGPEAAAMFQLFARKGWTSNCECFWFQVSSISGHVTPPNMTGLPHGLATGGLREPRITRESRASMLEVQRGLARVWPVLHGADLISGSRDLRLRSLSAVARPGPRDLVTR